MSDEGLSRRRFLRYAGGGGALILAGATGFIDLRAITQGVFETEDGPAYTAWDEWQEGEGPMRLVAAAILAANAHDSQPWLFGISDRVIEIHADRERNIGAVDPLLREMYISLGCALENCVIAAPASGYTPRVAVLPERRNARLAARIELAQGQAEPSDLYAAIPERHTDRGEYHSREVAQELLDEIAGLSDAREIDIVWFSEDPDKQAFGDLTIRATEAFIADERQSSDSFAWFRTDWDEIQRLKSGVTTDAAGLSPLVRSLAKLVPAPSRDSTDDAWLDRTRDPHVSTAAAFGLIVARDRLDRAQQIEAGRLYQRAHLWATDRGLAIHPLNQTVERVDRELTAGLPPEITEGVEELLPAGWGALMPFRIGYSSNETLESPRRPAEDVLIGS